MMYEQTFSQLPPLAPPLLLRRGDESFISQPIRAQPPAVSLQPNRATASIPVADLERLAHDAGADSCAPIAVLHLPPTSNGDDATYEWSEGGNDTESVVIRARLSRLIFDASCTP